MTDKINAVLDYIAKIEKIHQTGDATEHTYRPALKDLLEKLSGRVIAANEPKHRDWGAPDYLISEKNTGKNPLTIGYIEAKDVGVDLDKAEKSGQVKRYCAAHPNIILTDYLEFRWFLNQKAANKACLGRITPQGKIRRDPEGAERVLEILEGFLSQSPQPVGRAKELAARLASLTQIIRDIISESFRAKKASETMTGLLQAFRQTLIHNLGENDFADIFAQTMTYGLFAARRFDVTSPEFSRDKARHLIPQSNPFLQTFFDIVTGTKLDDEPFADMVEEIVQLLRMTDMEAVMEDFGIAAGKKDPIFHFYETFLAAYNPRERKRRGVFYTPEPVVSYIVRSVDYLLKDRFKLEKGLADDSKIGGADIHKALILDPACGTGTFLYHVIDHIRAQLQSVNAPGLWDGYVGKSLLPRMIGFELIMAPYAIAHLKIGMELAALDQPALFREKWAYHFKKNERVKIFLTNTLEEATHKIQREMYILNFMVDEANEAIKVKKELPIMVILGNPPYSATSANTGQWITKLVKDSYYPKDNIKEQNPKLLLDDYVKFIRWAQWRIERTGAGILAFITNHGYLDNPTFRAMRKSLMDSFDEIYILDLHGNAKKKERCPDGSSDQNVFDIQQGVAIGIFVRNAAFQAARGRRDASAAVRHADLWGPRKNKARRKGKSEWLKEHEIKNTNWKKLAPTPPFYLFIPQKTRFKPEYEKTWSIKDIFPVNSTGIKTHRDHFAIAHYGGPMWHEDPGDRKFLTRRIADFRNMDMEDHIIRRRYNLKDTRDWKLHERRESLAAVENWKDHIRKCLYRPFDVRYTYFHPDVIELPRTEVMRHMVAGENISLISVRQVAENIFNHVFVTKNIVESRVTLSNKGMAFIFPLYLYPDPDVNGELFENGTGRHVNINPGFSAELSRKLDMKYNPHRQKAAFPPAFKRGAPRRGKKRKRVEDPKTFGPEDIFNYIYAVFHSPTYRERYSDFLKMDFPRAPLTSDRKLFGKLCSKGAELAALHLLDFKRLDYELKPVAGYPVSGDSIVHKGHPKWRVATKINSGDPKRPRRGNVYINTDESQERGRAQYFSDVPENVWNFHIGGYQVCEKYLKDRRGKDMDYDELVNYINIVTAINETIRVMGEIDSMIPSWPIE